MFGRAAATVDGFRYSKDIKTAAENGLIWNDDTMAVFLKNPKEYIGSLIGKKKGKIKMSFRGLRKDKDIANVIAYIRENSQ